MESVSKERIEKIWRQAQIPVVYRRGTGNPLLVKIPFSKDNHAWLKGDHRNKPKWIAQYKCWETPNSWFNDVVNKSLIRYSKVYIIQPYRQQEKCAPACWHATGHECECSCMGANHGSQGPKGKWFVVSDTFATQWHEKELACRLLKRAASA